MRSNMILLSSSYSNSTGIALDFLERDFHNVQGVIDEIIDKCHSETLKRYQGYSAYGLIDITHRPGSPWTHCDSSKENEQIDDSVIRKFHDVEEV